MDSRYDFREEMLTVDLEFHRICEKVDYWKHRALNAEKELKEEKDKYWEQFQERQKQVNKDIGNALMFAMSVEEKPDGSMNISKDNRKSLAKHYDKNIE